MSLKHLYPRFSFILKTILALFLVLFVPIWFVLSSMDMEALASFFGLRTDPSYSGGEEIAVIYDTFGDDTGEGGLTYPANTLFSTEGTLDLISYRVFRPQIGSPWSDEPHYWQLGFNFRNADKEQPFKQQIIRCYIDLKPGGSTETPEARAELVRFPEHAAWDMVLTISPYRKKGTIRTYDGSWKRDVQVFRVQEKASVYARLPLQGPLTDVLDGRTTRHYVCIGAADPLSTGGFMSVSRRASSGKGGGALSRMTPRIYDYLAPPEISQQELLSGYDRAAFQYAELAPVTVEKTVSTPSSLARLSPLFSIPKGFTDKASGNSSKTQKRIAELDEKINRQNKAQRNEMQQKLKTAEKQYLAAETSKGNTDRSGENTTDLGTIEPYIETAVRYGTLLFQTGNIEKAEPVFKEVIKLQPENPASLAYLGSITAMIGGRKGPAEAIRYVREGLEMIDRAIAAADSAEIKITALVSRAEVSMAVPEEVFGAAETGAQCFDKAAELLLSNGKTEEASDCIVKAGICYRQTGMDSQAESRFLQAASMEKLNPYAERELLKRGFLTFSS